MGVQEHWQEQDRRISEWVADPAILQHFKKQVGIFCEIPEAFAKMLHAEAKMQTREAAEEWYSKDRLRAEKMVAAAKAKSSQMTAKLREIYKHNGAQETEETEKMQARAKALQWAERPGYEPIGCAVNKLRKRRIRAKGHIRFLGDIEGFYGDHGGFVESMPHGLIDVREWFHCMVYGDRTPPRSEADKKLYQYVLLACLHDEQRRRRTAPVLIYRDAPYDKPLFKRDVFFEALWDRMNGARAADYMKDVEDAIKAVEKDVQGLRAAGPDVLNLSQEEARVLSALVDEHPLWTTQEKLERPTGLTRKTIGVIIGKLKKQGLACAPADKVYGVAATPQGVAHAEKYLS